MDGQHTSTPRGRRYAADKGGGGGGAERESKQKLTLCVWKLLSKGLLQLFFILCISKPASQIFRFRIDEEKNKKSCV